MKKSVFANGKTLDILIIAILALIPFLKYFQVFVPETNLAFDLNPDIGFFKRYFLWENGFNFGTTAFYTANIYHYFSKLIYLFKINPQIIKQLWYTFLLFVTGYSMYIFSGIYIAEKRLLKIISAMAYMYNIFVVRVLMGASTLLLGYAILPLQLTILILGLQRKKRKFFYAILFSLTTIFLSNTNFTLIAINIIVILIYLIFHTYITRFKNISATIKYIFFVFICSFFISLWWILPLFSNTTSTQLSIEDALSAETPETYNLRSSFFESFRLLGEWGFYGQYKYRPYVPFANVYLSSGLILSTFSLSILAFLSLLLMKNIKKKLFIMILILIFIPMAVGANPINNPSFTGKIYLWMYEYIPFFSIFRNGYKSIAVISFTYTILIGFSIKSINNFFKEKKSFTIKILRYSPILVIVILILLNSFPLWTNTLFDNKSFDALKITLLLISL